MGTQYRSALYWTDEAQRDARSSARATPTRRARRARPRADHDRDRRGRALLLRRGLPPAVPGEEPGRLLRPRRHGRLLPDRRGRRRRRRLSAGAPPWSAPSGSGSPSRSRSSACPHRAGRGRSRPHRPRLAADRRGRPDRADRGDRARRRPLEPGSGGRGAGPGLLRAARPLAGLIAGRGLAGPRDRAAKWLPCPLFAGAAAFACTQSTFVSEEIA